MQKRMTHFPLEMFRFTREMEFMDENQAFDIYTSFLKRKRGKSITPKGIDFVKSYCKTKDTDILRKLEDIPYFEQDNEYIRINIVLFIAYIAHKIRLEFLWQRFLNYVIQKYFIKSILQQYPDHCKHELFIHIPRAVGNLVQKRHLQNS